MQCRLPQLLTQGILAAYLAVSAGASHGLDLSVQVVQGWNLVATGEVLSPAQLDAKLGGIAGAPSFTTMWAWNSGSASWYFYAPTLMNRNR